MNRLQMRSRMKYPLGTLQGRTWLTALSVSIVSAVTVALFFSSFPWVIAIPLLSIAAWIVVDEIRTILRE
jgi:1,4-dihydroxy-2-naphthoate octaprenyltransferase